MTKVAATSAKPNLTWKMRHTAASSMTVGRDVEQHEIEHRVDRRGAPLDDAGDTAGLAIEVEAQREIVEMREQLLGDDARGVAGDALEGDIAQIVRQHAAETGAGVSEHQREDELRLPLHARAHAVDDALVGERHDERDRLAEQHQHQSDHDARTQARLALGPEIRQETAQGRPSRDHFLVGLPCV